jgi:VanZ family protein
MLLPMIESLPAGFRRFCRWLFVPALAVVIWGELKPSTHGADMMWDKVLHFTAYFGLTSLATVALRERGRAIWAAFALALFGGILEIVQGFVGRDAEWGDELANVVGVVTGLAAGLLTLQLLRRFAPQPSGASGGADETVR